ncbi:hypothetical protein tb265_44520 [Gemmatimonadetes bacterium T265]|nr:hypothetical protein tb265_44520 [Gemmatimonadetes bacterium T265]
MASSEILCVGELLWDALPAGLFLGGAPFNVACHLRAAGLAVAMVSRVGADHLGDEALRRAARYGIATDLVQVDPALPTGLVRVTLDEAGEGGFDIVAPAAWDAIELNDALLGRASEARAIVFGSLAQRSAVTRATVERLWATGALLVFDANLRAPYDDPEVVRRSLRSAAVVKVSDRELWRLASWFGLPGGAPGGALRRGARRGPAPNVGGRPNTARAGARGDAPPVVPHGTPQSAPMRETVAALADAFGCRTVCVTRGGHGAALWDDGQWTEHPGFEVEVRDTIGAGDAFLAVLLAGLLAGTEARAILQHANLIAAYVATQPGAVPADQPAGAPPVGPPPAIPGE